MHISNIKNTKTKNGGACFISDDANALLVESHFFFPTYKRAHMRSNWTVELQRCVRNSIISNCLGNHFQIIVSVILQAKMSTLAGSSSWDVGFFYSFIQCYCHLWLLTVRLLVGPKNWRPHKLSWALFTFYSLIMIIMNCEADRQMNW